MPDGGPACPTGAATAGGPSAVRTAHDGRPAAPLAGPDRARRRDRWRWRDRVPVAGPGSGRSRGPAPLAPAPALVRLQLRSRVAGRHAGARARLGGTRPGDGGGMPSPARPRARGRFGSGPGCRSRFGWGSGHGGRARAAAPRDARRPRRAPGARPWSRVPVPPRGGHRCPAVPAPRGGRQPPLPRGARWRPGRHVPAARGREGRVGYWGVNRARRAARAVPGRLRAPPEGGPGTYARTTAAVRASACSRTTT